jgi:hypothetical protein
MTQQRKARLISELVKFIEGYVAGHPRCSKEELSNVVAKEFELQKERKVYVCRDFAVRFSSASGPSFSNVVLSLSALQKYDTIPFVICIVRPSGAEFVLANSSFLKKISHSSHQLRVDNVRGSFLGHDIVREVGGIANTPSNFEKLFSIHQASSWEENLTRLVRATGNIAPTGARFAPSEQECVRILSSADLALSLSGSPEYLDLGTNLNDKALQNASEILEAAQIDNINKRGNTIEQIITKAANIHGLEDLTFTLRIGTRVLVDVKTKVLALTSSPKGYNIDKFLATLAEGNTVFAFFFIGIDVENHRLVTRLVSVLDRTILNATRIQFHWAGRNSRGVTQLTGDLTPLFERGFRELIELDNARVFLQKLIDL